MKKLPSGCRGGLRGATISKQVITTMKFSTKLLLVIVLSALIPALVIGFFSYFLVSSSMRQTAFNQLVSVRDIKASAIERYFRQVQNQIEVFAEDDFIRQALLEMSEAFDKIESENHLEKQQITEFGRGLEQYYREQFGRKYKEENLGETANISSLLNLPQESRLAQALYISQNPNPLGSKHLMNASDDASSYSKSHAVHHPYIRTFLEKFGYYDIFLIDRNGRIVYTVFKELDYATSLENGPYSGSNFAQAYREAATTGRTVIVDYDRYLPSYNAPASFAACPVNKDGEFLGVVAFQMPLAPVNEIMSERAGMGESGESYLVGHDNLMRSDSFLDPENHSVVASFTNPEKGSVKTDATKRAANGENGYDVIIDYNGNPVLSAFMPLTVGGLEWMILSEIDKAEAFAAITTLRNWSMALLVIVALGSAALSVILARNLMKPIGGEPAGANLCMEEISKGDLTALIDVKKGDDSSMLFHLRSMTEQLNAGFVEITEGINYVASATTELSAISS